MILTTLLLVMSTAAPAHSFALPDTIGRKLYESGCASCHGVDGRGTAPERVAFTEPVPDFTACSFASREPDADWAAVIHAGGPVRGFSETMPSFGEAFTPAEIQSILDYVRTFCSDLRWPRGELNLPRSQFTEKAYPEDEAVLTLRVDTESPRGGESVLVYEKRFGPRSQIELELPFAFQRTAAGKTERGVGDVAVALKHALWHSLSAGGILSAGMEVVLPTGSEQRGLGGGTFVFEPFLLYGHALPRDAFLQFQGIVEIPAERDRGEVEGVMRAVVGKTFTSGQFGRSWTPMLETLSSFELEEGHTAIDVVPQLQVTLNTRQHVIANFGVRVPVNDRATRGSQLVLYILWDWFDGGFFAGW